MSVATGLPKRLDPSQRFEGVVIAVDQAGVNTRVRALVRGIVLQLDFAVARHMTMRNIINSNTYRYPLVLYRYMKRYLTH
jgi:hypothetical protein